MATVQDLKDYVAEHGRRPYWLSLLISVDQLANAMLWGYVDETLSSRCYRCRDKKWRWKLAEACINTLFFWDKRKVASGIMRHCEIAYHAEHLREHLPGVFFFGR